MIRIVVVGAGGLAGPIVLGLVSAGVEVTVFDGDTVELSNLHRQIQFHDADLGQNKAQVLTAWAGASRAYPLHWTPALAEQTCNDCDLIVDATDSAETKFAVADWATGTGRPYVIAAALGVMGSVMLGAPSVACYRCWFEAPPTQANTCSEAGVLGPILAMVAAIATDGALALAQGNRQTAGTLWTCDDLSSAEPKLRQRGLAARADCPTCQTSPLPPGQVALRWAEVAHGQR